MEQIVLYSRVSTQDQNYQSQFDDLRKWAKGNNFRVMETFGEKVLFLVEGVTKGFEKDLEITGVGYRATQQGADIQFHLGFSHPIVYKAPVGVILQVVEQTKVKVKGSSKEKVGQTAAEIRFLKPPEPYKGKGIRFKDEKVRRKAGKTGKK